MIGINRLDGVDDHDKDVDPIPPNAADVEIPDMVEPYQQNRRVFSENGQLWSRFGHFGTTFGTLTAVGRTCFLYPCCGSCAAHCFDLQGSFLAHLGSLLVL